MATVEIDAFQEASAQFVGRWNHLISTSNWEKGRIILQWRSALQESGAPPSEYADEAWARRVGGVSSQHVGRLRRVSERFGAQQEQYAGLYWSHFLAALDWDDAEMWLEGGVQNGWSIKQMIAQRADTLGLTTSQPADEELVASEPDEDVDPAALGEAAITGVEETVVSTGSPSTADETDGERDGDADAQLDREDDGEEGEAPWDGEGDYATTAASAATPQVRPFESLPSLPEDVQDALEAFKLCIVRHKLCGWEEISRDGILACLDALRTLALTPAE